MKAQWIWRFRSSEFWKLNLEKTDIGDGQGPWRVTVSELANLGHISIGAH